MVFQALCTSRDDCHMWAHQVVRCLYPAKTCQIPWILQTRQNAWTRTCCRAPCAQADFSNTVHPLANCYSYSYRSTTHRHPSRWARPSSGLHQSRRMAMTATKVRMLPEHTTVGPARSESGSGKGKKDDDVGAGVGDGVRTEIGAGVGAGVAPLGDGVGAGIGTAVGADVGADTGVAVGAGVGTALSHAGPEP